MEGKHLLASPNWYNSAVCDVSAEGIFAFGGRNAIFLLDLAGAESCKFLGQLCGHKDRVTSVSFSKSSAYSRLCVSGSEDHSVAVWDVDAQTVICKHNQHQSKVTAVCWSLSCHDWIISGDEKGHILSWNYQQNQVYEHIPLQGHIFCIQCSPNEEGIVAVGYKTGQILVLLLKNEDHEVVNVLKGHNDEIHSLVWSPVGAAELPEVIFGVPRRQESGFILASGSRDKSIKLWDISTGQFIAAVNVPNRTSARKIARDEPHLKSRLWSTLCWPQTQPNNLLSSGYNGDILLWDLATVSKQKWELFGSGASLRHSRIVFNICQYAVKDIIISVSMDRLINIWSRSETKILSSLPSLGGFVYSLGISVMNPSCIAAGVGDNMIRVWETLSTKDGYAVKTLWREIGTKVMKVLWHPVKEGMLAFGTEEGKVGIYNVMSQTPRVSRTYHKKSVYSLSWGPPSGISEGDGEFGIWHLYSCGGEGMVLEHNPDHFHDEAKNIDKLIKSTNNIKHNLAGHSEVSWKPDRLTVAIGNEDGSIQLYRAPDFKLISTINVHHKSITCLAWYYSHGVNDLVSSMLASSSNGFEVHVHDLRSILEARSDSSDESAVITSSFQRLVGHHGRVTNVAWSPHSSSQLASSSYDGTVQVWDVRKGEGLANYRGHSGRVMSIAWSVMDSDILFSGSEDFTVRTWRISQQLYKEPPAEAARKFPKNKGKKKKKKTEGVSQNTDIDNKQNGSAVTVDEERQPLDIEEVNHGEEPKEIVQNQKDNVGPVSDAAAVEYGLAKEVNLQFLSPGLERNQDIYNTAAVSQEPSLNVKADAKKKKKKAKSLFPLSANADNKSRTITSQECVQVAQVLSKDRMSNEGAAGRSVNLGLFTDRRSAFNMLTEEGIHHLQTGNIDYQLQLEVWKGNIGQALELAVEKRQLNDWLVGISHLAGDQVRLAVTEAFAEQLASHGSYHRAALYYLACHKVYDAIRMFHTVGMYREAIALAKVRLLPSDPVLLDLYSSWARKLENECAFEQAAKCYLACGLHDDATRVLTRRADETSLFAAAQVARLTNQIELSESLILQCALFATRKGKWNDALEMVRGYSDMQAFLMQMFTHHVLAVHLMHSGAITSDDLPEMQDFAGIQAVKASSQLPHFLLCLQARYEERICSDPTTHWGCRMPPDSYSVSRILEEWWSHCGPDLHEKRLHGFYVQIAAFSIGPTPLTKESVEHILMTVSKDICLGLVASLVGNPDLCLEHFAKAIVKCHECGHTKLLRYLFILLFPFGLESWYMIKDLHESPLHKTVSVPINNVDQFFCNMNAFYYRALLDETLSDCLEVVKETMDGDSPGKDTSVNELAPIQQTNAGGESEQSLARRRPENQIWNNESGEELNVKPISEVDLCSDGFSLKDITEEKIACVKQWLFSDVYRVALVSSSVLLSEVHAQLQIAYGNCEDVQTELSYDRSEGTNNYDRERDRTLSKLPFPDVLRSAYAIVELCESALKMGCKEEVVEFLILSRQVANWGNRHARNEDDKAFFENALDKINNSFKG